GGGVCRGGVHFERWATKCRSMPSTWMRSAPARSASATCSPRRAKSAARIEGASRTRSPWSGGTVPLDVASDRAVVQQVTRDIVEPNALAEVVQLSGHLREDLGERQPLHTVRPSRCTASRTRRAGPTANVGKPRQVDTGLVAEASPMRPIVWLMISKIYPLRNRYRAMAVSTASNWGPKLLVRLSFPIVAGTGASHQTGC